MKLSRKNLRKIILEELSLLKEADFSLDLPGRGKYGLDYKEEGDEYIITAFYRDGEKLKQGFGKELGSVFDSSGINRLESQFKIKVAKGKSVKRELS
jgi:hypothetical protein